MIECKICGKKLYVVSGLHLRVHGISTEEYRRKFPEAPLMDDEIKLKISTAKKGWKPPDYVMKRAHEAAAVALRGKPRPEEVKRKISLSKQERKKRLGYINSPETRKKISESKKGRKLSESHKRAISEGVRRAYEKDPNKRVKVSQASKNLFVKRPELREKYRVRMIEEWKTEGKERARKIREERRRHKVRHTEEILKAIRDFEAQGYRCIPIDHRVAKVLPDFLVLPKDCKVFAVEVEVGKDAAPKPQKYLDINYFDDVYWIIIREEDRYADRGSN